MSVGRFETGLLNEAVMDYGEQACVTTQGGFRSLALLLLVPSNLVLLQFYFVALDLLVISAWIETCLLSNPFIINFDICTDYKVQSIVQKMLLHSTMMTSHQHRQCISLYILCYKYISVENERLWSQINAYSDLVECLFSLSLSLSTPFVLTCTTHHKTWLSHSILLICINYWKAMCAYDVSVSVCIYLVFYAVYFCCQ